MDHLSDFLGSYDFSPLNQADLKVLQQAESQINQNKADKIILIAYEKNKKG